MRMIEVGAPTQLQPTREEKKLKARETNSNFHFKENYGKCNSYLLQVAVHRNSD